MLRRIPVTLTLACAALVALALSGAGEAQAAARHHSLPTHVNSCWTTDNGAPVVDSVNLSAHAVDVTGGPATVTITIGAHDTGGPGPRSGLTAVRVLAEQFWDDSSHTGADNAAKSVTLNRHGAHWVGTYAIPQDYHAMQVRFTSVELDTAAGPTALIDLTGRGNEGIVQVTSDHPDTAGPTLTHLALSTDNVDVSQSGQDVQVTAQISDDDTGLATALVFYTGQLPHVGIPLTPTQTPGEFEATIHVSRWVGTPRMPLSFRLTDAANNVVDIDPQDLATMGAPSQITVTGSPADPAAPRVPSVGGGPHLVNVRRGGGQWNIRVHARDQGSGVGTVAVTRPYVDGTRTSPAPIQLHLISGTPYDGVWGGRIPISRCISSPGRVEVSVTATDRAGLSTAVGGEGPRLLGPDRVAPDVSDFDDGGSSHVVSLGFSEPVHGISRHAVTVNGYLTHRGPIHVLAGTWTCRNIHNHRVSCRTGSVRYAAFRYTQHTMTPVSVAIEANGHLDVLDRHGNPDLETDDLEED